MFQNNCFRLEQFKLREAFAVIQNTKPFDIIENEKKKKKIVPVLNPQD